MYLRDPAPLVFAELIHAARGEFEQALNLALQGYRLAPRRQLYAPIVRDEYIRLDRFDDAEAVAESHFAQGFDNPQVHRFLLRMSWMQGDQASAEKQQQWFTEKLEEHKGLEEQAAHARMLGQVALSLELLEQAAASARQWNLSEVAERLVALDPEGAALLGDCAPARGAKRSRPWEIASPCWHSAEILRWCKTLNDVWKSCRDGVPAIRSGTSPKSL